MNELMEKVKNLLKNNKQDIYEAISRDYKEKGLEINYNKLEDIINKIKDINNMQKAHRNILVIYNGDLYVTFELILKAIAYGSNIILTSQNKESYTTVKIISIMQELVKEANLILKFYKEVNLKMVLKEEVLIDRIIYFGDKRNYRALRSKTNIPIIYNGYGSISVYVDDEDEFEDFLSKLEEYAYLNEMYIYKQTGDIGEAIEEINKDGKNNLCIIFSNDEEKINKFKAEINSTNILINNVNLEELKPEILLEYFV